MNADEVDLKAYLFTTLRNRLLKSCERGRRVAPVEVPEPVTPAAIEDDPQRSLLLRRQIEEVRVAAAGLAPRQRLALSLRELEDCNYAEIGSNPGLPQPAPSPLTRAPPAEIASTRAPTGSCSGQARARQPRNRPPQRRRRHLAQRPALIRLAGMQLIEQNDEWLVGRRYLSQESLAALATRRTELSGTTVQETEQYQLEQEKETAKEVPALVT